MKQHIPTDLDKLMWTIAESGDMEAADDFERRFPQFRRDLAIRLGMVRSLRRSKPSSMTSDKGLPKFVPNETATVPTRRPMWPVAALASLAFVVFASYVVIANLPKPEASAPPSRSSTIHPGKQLPTTESGTKGSDGGDTQNGNESDTGVKATPNKNETTPPIVEMPWDKPQAVSIQGAPLVDVLKLIADTCHLSIELAPDMPNPPVSVNYVGRTGMQMLQDLGRQYKFTPLDQGKGQVLIVPATQFTNPQ